MFKKMVEIEASDLYLTVARPPMCRVEGKVRPIGEKNFTRTTCMPWPMP